MPHSFRFLLGLPMAAALLAPGITVAAPVSQADRDQARAMLEQIISIRTLAGEGQVPRMAEVLANRLKEAGFRDEDIRLVPVDKDGERTVGLVVRYQGSDDSLRPVAILGHMDVVGAIPANWQTEPFTPTEKDGYLYGRGAVDNKAGVAAVVSSFARLKREGFQPERTLLIAFSGDEETGMATTRALTEDPWVSKSVIALNSDAGSGAVSDGKYEFSIQSAEKTYATFFLSAANEGGHSSAPKAENAIYDLAAALQNLSELRFPVEFNEITRPAVAKLAADKGGEFGEALNTLLRDPRDSAARAVAERYPEYSNILWTTCVPTMLAAGNAPNALPQNATATVNCRIFPGTSVESVRQNIVNTIQDPEISVVLDGEPVVSPVSPPHEDLFALLTRAVHVNYPGASVMPSMSSGGTDGRQFRSAGIPTYGAGSLALKRPEDSRAHGIDERVPLEAFYKELNYWDYLLREVGSMKL